MYKPVTSQNLALFFSLAPMLLSAPSFAQQNDIYTTQNGHAIVQDVEKPGTRIELMKTKMSLPRRTKRLHSSLL